MEKVQKKKGNVFKIERKAHNKQLKKQEKRQGEIRFQMIDTVWRQNADRYCMETAKSRKNVMQHERLEILWHDRFQKQSMNNC